MGCGHCNLEPARRITDAVTTCSLRRESPTSRMACSASSKPDVMKTKVRTNWVVSRLCCWLSKGATRGGSDWVAPGRYRSESQESHGSARCLAPKTENGRVHAQVQSVVAQRRVTMKGATGVF